MDDFEKWWLDFTKLEPGEWDINAMAAAGGAWTYQQKKIDELEARIADLECALGQAELDHKELVYDCRDHRTAKEKAEAELAALGEALLMFTENSSVQVNCPVECEKAEALLQGEGDE